MKSIAKWMIFGVLISLIPFAVACLRASSQIDALTIDKILPSVVGRGELLLVVVALCSAACGEIFSWNGESPTAKTIIGGASVVFGLLAIAYYGEIASMYSASKPTVDVDRVVTYSLYLFVGAIIASGCAVVLTRER